MKFSVPVTFTISGWVEIEAATLKEAKEKAPHLEVDVTSLHDKDDSCEIHTDEIARIKDA